MYRRPMNRRQLLKMGAAAGTAALLPASLLRAAPLPQGVDESDLIYLTPIRSDGSESRCQAEIWFVRDADDLVVVTSHDRWRAQAVRQGLTAARIWVGDVGVWDEEARYKALPELLTTASFETDPGVHARLLESFGTKYASQWGRWGPRFRNGLADGSRVMLRYSPV